MKRFTVLLMFLLCILSFGENYWDIGNFLIRGEKDAKKTEITSENIIIDSDRKVELNSFRDLFKNVTTFNIVEGNKNPSFNIEGFNNMQYSITLDGSTVYGVYDNYVDISELTVQDFSKVRIVRGVESLLNGPDAAGVSIELETEKPLFQNKNTLNFKFSEYNNRFIDFKHEGMNGDFAYYARFTKSEKDGWGVSKNYSPNIIEDGGLRDNTDSKRNSMNIYLGKKGKKYSHGLRIMTLDNERGLAIDTVGKSRYWRFTDWDKKQYSYNFIREGDKNRLEMIVYRDTYYNVLDSYDNKTFTTQTKPFAFHSTYDDVSDGVKIVPEYSLDNMDISMLLYYKKDKHEEQDNTGVAWEEYGAETYSYAIVSDFRNGLKTGLSWSEKSIDDHDESFDDTNYSVEYSLNKKNYIEISRKHRFPTIKEMYSGYLGSSIPNPALTTEKITMYSWYNKNVLEDSDIKYRLFMNKVEDQIEKITVSPGVDQNQNIGDVYYTGVSIDYNSKINNGELTLSASYIDPENKTAAVDKVNNFSRVNADITLRRQVRNNNLAYNLHHSGESFQEISGVWETIPSYYTVNIYYDNTLFENSVTKKFYINIKNIFDRDYYTYIGRPSEGKSLEIGQMITW